ncbi:hypothetical protein CR513_28793, partial [Mucuna pruriens]
MCGEKVSDLSVIEKILRSMTIRYDYVVYSIEESHNLDSTTVDELQSSLLVHKQQMNGHNSHEKQALKVAQDEANIGRGQRRNVFRGGVTQGRDCPTTASLQCHQLKFGTFHMGYPPLSPQLNFANIVSKGSIKEILFHNKLIHSDICGPINPTSSGNKRYILTFLDDLSRKVWVYFVVEKDEALDVFKKFKTLVKKQVGVSIQILRIDRGGEYTSKEFVEFCNEQGIQRQLTASYTPQQNGVAGRKNQTIISMVRSVLTKREVPRSFWSKAVNWVVHILNRSPTLAVKNITLEEAWSGMKPSVSYFRIFGCIGFVHVPDQKRSKLDDKSTKCVLLGVSEESKTYKLYDPINEKIHISRDVKFQEDVAWDWEVSTEGRARKPPTWMKDYFIGDNLTYEDAINFAMFARADPVTYNQA